MTAHLSRPVAPEAGIDRSSLIGAAVDWFRLQETIVWMVVMGFITMLNYTLSKLWVFAAKAEGADEVGSGVPTGRYPARYRGRACRIEPVR